MAKHMKVVDSLCPFCLEETIYKKPYQDSKYLCRNCNGYIPEDLLIRIPFEIVKNRLALSKHNKYYYNKKMDKFKESIRKMGKIGEVYVEIDMEVE